MDLTNEERDVLGKKLMTIVVSSANENILSQEEMSIMCSVLLEQVPKLKTKDDVTIFLKNLADVWPIFSNMKDIELGMEQQKEEAKQIENIQDLIKEDKVDEALASVTQ